jgi:hypothetical protein
VALADFAIIFCHLPSAICLDSYLR